MELLTYVVRLIRSIKLYCTYENCISDLVNVDKIQNNV